MQSQQQYEQKISLEFFPPRTEKGMEKLKTVIQELSPIQPEYMSVTYGAGGTTQSRTIDTVRYIQTETDNEAAPHLTCIGASEESVLELLDTYEAMGIKRIVALRGDLPSGMMDPGEFKYASDLIAFIRRERGDTFKLEVAAYPETHPQARNCNIGIKWFKHKVEQGADSAITQYFYNVDSYLYFIDNCERSGIDLPIVPGIMPITNYENLVRFSEGCGAEVPRWLKCRLESFEDDQESLLAFGEDVVTELSQRLLDAGAPGLHFYSMNQSKPVLNIVNQLTFKDR
ncbi:methylenetetrahydrofolate reductase [NAD(P)H] [Thiomicrospira sp. S5]|uniref:methylenetetrahydrofolate reductase [NAD(P)H] n=1 Tax=Thiomicrospira sp. S5 TaxID=1803865 RepID=UPI000F89F452|nr:methylenetetrahydrofolate reductase [NAD(P)H] [Thiomicrospira sp. S5]AZR81369.1 5,10-methylenetetrahydrofolate reductase [Thiomicrospira sp. S5]AZR81538.1 5,10-methylenetetrahydrofolate reductase [Thiomicrospira sp. S5]